MKKSRLLIILLALMVNGQWSMVNGQNYVVSSLLTGSPRFDIPDAPKGVITMPFKGGERTIEIATSQKLTVKSDAEWCRAKITEDTLLTVTVDINEGDDAREALLSITAKDIKTPHIVTVRQESRLRFAVISDVHVGNSMGVGPTVKIPRALKNLTKRGKLDALAVVGDLTNGGTESQYKQFTKMFGADTNFINPVGKMLFMMGNHDNYDGNGKRNYQAGLKSFNMGRVYPYHQYVKIKGYPFITISDFGSANNDINNPSAAEKSYPQESRDSLTNMLARAAQEAPGKPIFVFLHVGPNNGCYSTWADFENGEAWSMGILNPILNKYPQVVVFCAHSHYPIGDPRSIHQGVDPKSTRENYYTAINTASTTYSEIHPGAVEEGIHPAGYENVTEGMILQEDDEGNIDIFRYDTFRDLEILPNKRWRLDAPHDGSKFKYADTRDAADNETAGKPLRDGKPAPVFEEDAKPELEVTSYSVKVTFPQATDDECVFRYNIRVLQGKKVVKSNFLFSQFYLYSDMPQQLSYTATGLTPETEYTLEVVAYDSYDNKSTPLKTTFTTLEDNDPSNQVPEAVGVWTFDDPNNLMAGTGTLQATTHTQNNVTVHANPADANITVVDGPTEDNGAINLPVGSSLKMTSDAASKTYTFMFDIRSEDLTSYTPFFSNSLNNSKDGSFFIKNGQVGLSFQGLGYGGALYTGQWHRVLFVSDNCTVTTYIDGQKVGQSTGGGSQTPETHWQLNGGALFFADENGEEKAIQTAEVRFWNVALTERQAAKLGAVKTDQPIEPVEVPDATGTWTFDDTNDLLAGSGMKAMQEMLFSDDATLPVTDPSETKIKIVEGPKTGNGAIEVPVHTGLMMEGDPSDTKTYTWMMDIRLDQTGGYTALFQNDITNDKDGSLFINNGKMGLNGSHGLGYNGSIIAQQWHRLVFVVNQGIGTAYIDGERVGQSSQPCPEHWEMNGGALLFFLDNDGEEHIVKTSEIRFWDAALTPAQVKALGEVETDEE
ncbi:MAG: metallophosphoesterase [Bacteroidaceae bacterium]|nr:metallophosphoesterase [Bacteroidaceae bacterium]